MLRCQLASPEQTNHNLEKFLVLIVIITFLYVYIYPTITFGTLTSFLGFHGKAEIN